MQNTINTPTKNCTIGTTNDIQKFTDFLNSKNYSKQTIKLYNWFLKRYLLLYGKEISLENVQKFPLNVGILMSRSNGKEYLYREQPSIKSFLKLYILCFYPNKESLLIKIMLDKSHGRKRLRLPRYLEKTEILSLINNETSLKNKAILSLLYDGALRESELCNIKIRDINLERKQIKIRGKGNRESLINISDNTLNLITTYIKTNFRDNTSIINKEDTKEYISKYIDRSLFEVTPKQVWTIVMRAGENIGYKFEAGKKNHIFPHMVRHSTATHLLEDGWPLNKIQKFLRHESITTTQIYAHLSDVSFNKDAKDWLNK